MLVSYKIDRQLITIYYINHCKNWRKNSYDSRITQDTLSFLYEPATKGYLGCVWFDVKKFSTIKYFQVKIFFGKEKYF